MQPIRLFLALILASTLTAAAVEPDPAQGLSNRIMTYYQHPEPDRFVELVKSMVLLDMLRGNRPDMYVMFLGKIMAQNPAKIAGWLDELAFLEELEPKNAAVLHRAAWYSGTAEAKAWLVAHGHQDLAQREPPPLLSNTLMTFEPYHLDLLWEWFFATGEDEPIHRIISCFQLVPVAPLADSIEIPPPVATTDRNADEIAKANYRLVDAAVWSAASLAVTHQRVYDLLKNTSMDPSLKPMQMAWVLQVLKVATERRRTEKSPQPSAPMKSSP
jgi:hypothetical protein